MLRLAAHVAAMLLVAIMLGSTVPGIRIIGIPVALIVAAIHVRTAMRLAPTLLAAARA